MLNIYLCDDNRVILDKYKNLLEEAAEPYHILMNVHTFTSGEQLLFHMEANPGEGDIIYLDIQMEGKDGLETARKIREYGSQAQIIFLTGKSEYVFDAFDVSPTHYILKDTVSDERFKEILYKAAALAEKKSKVTFSCECGSVKKQIPVTEITYFEIHNRMVTVHYEKGTFDFYARLEDIEKESCLANFIRVHRSYLVHMQCVEQVNNSSLVLFTGETIPVGITYAKDVKKALSYYLNLFR